MQPASNDIKDALPTVTVRVGRAARPVVVGFLAVAVATAAARMLWLAWLSAWTRVDAAGPASTAELLTLVAASAAIALAAWLCLGVVLEVCSHLPGRTGAAAGRWADRLTPALARRVAAFVLGVGVGVAGGPSQAVGASRDLGASVSASAAPSPGFVPTHEVAAAPGFAPTHVDRTTPAPGFAPAPVRGPQPAAASEATPAPPAAPAPGFTPSAPRVRRQADPTLLGARPARPAGPAGADRTAAGPSDTDEVVVHRGDTLWSIAAAHLGPGAADAEVARTWPSWFEANRDVIGDDPDLLFPGQVLRVPDPSASAVR